MELRRKLIDFRLQRVLFGAYFLFQWIQLWLSSEETLSTVGLWQNQMPGKDNFSWSSEFVFLFTPENMPWLFVSGLLLIVLFILGWYRNLVSFLINLIFIVVYLRNPYLKTVIQPYLHWLLLLYTALPSDEKNWLSFKDKVRLWPKDYLISLTLVLGFSYLASGLSKVFHSHWMDGHALKLILSNTPMTLTWVYNWIPDWTLQLATWFVVLVETFFLPLFYWKPTRFWIWISSLSIHLGILVFMDFQRVPTFMILFHLLILPFLNTNQSNAPAPQSDEAP